MMVVSSNSFVLPNDHDPDSLIRRENFQKLLQQAPLLSDFVLLILLGNMTLVRPKVKSCYGRIKRIDRVIAKTRVFSLSTTNPIFP